MKNNIPASDDNIANTEVSVKNVKIWFYIIAAVIIVLALVSSYLKSSTGKLKISQQYISVGEYEKAYNMVKGIDTEIADAYSAYTWMMMHVEHLSEATEDEFGDTIAKIRGGLSSLEYNNNLLTDSEKTVMLSVQTALNKYDSEFRNIMNFKDNINLANNVYDQFVTFDIGNEFNPSKVKMYTESWKKYLDRANDYYCSITGTTDNMQGYEIVLNAIELTEKYMDKGIEKYGEDGTMYFTNGFKDGEKYPDPYNVKTIGRLTYEIEKALATDCFADVMEQI